MFAALNLMTACAIAIPIFVDGGPRGQVSESSESYVSNTNQFNQFVHAHNLYL